MKEKDYLRGMCWFILSIFASILNDVIAKFLSKNLNIYEISFYRFFFSTLILIPIITIRGYKSIRTKNILVHVLRGFLLFAGITGWIYGLKIAQLSVSTLINFSIPLFTLILGRIFLDEKVIYQRWIATFIGLFGVCISIDISGANFDYRVIIFVISAFLFSILDIINKKFVKEENMLCMIFYSSLISTILSSPFIFQNFSIPNINDFILLLILGLSANLILFFLLKAFFLIDATSVAPFRYLEFLFSVLAGFIFFKDLPTMSVLMGSAILIPSTIYIVLAEKRTIQNLDKKLNNR